MCEKCEEEEPESAALARTLGMRRYDQTMQGSNVTVADMGGEGSGSLPDCNCIEALQAHGDFPTSRNDAESSWASSRNPQFADMAIDYLLRVGSLNPPTAIASHMAMWDVLTDSGAGQWPDPGEPEV